MLSLKYTIANCVFLQDTTWKHKEYHINDSDRGHVRLK